MSGGGNEDASSLNTPEKKRGGKVVFRQRKMENKFHTFQTSDLKMPSVLMDWIYSSLPKKDSSI